MQIDATVIIGIIILMTFQSFSSNAYEKQYGEIITEYRHDYSQYFATAKILQECEPKDSKNCTDLLQQLEEIELRRIGNEKWVTDLGIAKSFDDFFSNVTFFSIGANLIANLINLAMVLPFAVSAIIESARVLKGDTDPNASNGGITAMMIGFGMVVLGFIAVILLMSCSTFVDMNCFNVNNIFPIPDLPTHLKP